jgi:glutamate 5-kinase
MDQARAGLIKGRRWVIKIGSALLTNNGKGLDQSAMQAWVEQMAELANAGFEIVLVSSGAVAAGMGVLGWHRRPEAINELQAAAAVGQMGLIQCYEQMFKQHSVHTAQILLINDDLANRKRYLNARSTLKTLIKHRVIPIVNENDTVATDEIRFGDNDTLAAMVANLIDADGLIIMTDQLGLFDSDPRNNPEARLISQAFADDDALDGMAGESKGALGRGGMYTKLRAARLAARSGTSTIIVGGSQPEVLRRIFAGEELGTCLEARQKPWAARKQWLAGLLSVSGTITLDDGAVNVLHQHGRSLLPVGVVAVSGDFERGEVVDCVNQEGKVIARGLINYSSDEATKILRKSSAELTAILGYEGDHEMIHRDNLVLVASR